MRALIVGRFQPPHRGHLFAIRDAHRRHERVLVGVGSSQLGHTRENPFTVAERFDLLQAALDDAALDRVHLFPIPDLHHHAAWVAHVESLVPRFDVALTNNPLTRRLFRAAGHRVEPCAQWRPDVCHGRFIRARWAGGDPATDLLPPGVDRLLARWDGPGRVARLAEVDAAGRA